MGEPLDQLHADLGLKRLSPTWAKLEIFIGLAAIAYALQLSGGHAAVFILGAYLAMAGNRSHLYQSNNRLIAYLASLITKTRLLP